MAKIEELSDEELIARIRGYNAGAAEYWRAKMELDRRTAERAGKSTHRWTVIAAIAGIIAAVAAVLVLFE